MLFYKNNQRNDRDNKFINRQMNQKGKLELSIMIFLKELIRFQLRLSNPKARSNESKT